MKVMIKDKDKESLYRIFDELNEPFEVLAYGSRVNGTAHEGSDLDLAIQTPNGKPFDHKKLIKLRESIQHSNIPILVEIRDLATLPESFQNIIQNTGVSFYNNMEHMQSNSFNLGTD